MMDDRIDLQSIRYALDKLDPSSAPILWARLMSCFKTQESQLQQLSVRLKKSVSQLVSKASQVQDPKIKDAFCRRLLTLHRVLKSLIKSNSSIISEMSVTVYNALTCGDDRQEIWGTRFCSEEAFSDEEWEEALKGSRPLTVEKPSFFKYYFIYALALAYTQLITLLTPRRWFNKIMATGPYQVNLYLGALPLATPFRNDLDILNKEGIGAVLSVVEPFENHSLGWISSPILPSQWEERGIKQLQIPMEDIGSSPIADVERGVEFIRWNVLNKNSVYVHCKAGQERSALIVMAYLIKYENLSAREAFASVKSQRYQAGFGDSHSKMRTLLDYERRVYGVSGLPGTKNC